MAHRLRIDAVHSSTSKEIQMSQSTQPSCQEPAEKDTRRVSRVLTYSRLAAIFTNEMHSHSRRHNEDANK